MPYLCWPRLHQTNIHFHFSSPHLHLPQHLPDVMKRWISRDSHIHPTFIPPFTIDLIRHWLLKLSYWFVLQRPFHWDHKSKQGTKPQVGDWKRICHKNNNNDKPVDQAADAYSFCWVYVGWKYPERKTPPNTSRIYEHPHLEEKTMFMNQNICTHK